MSEETQDNSAEEICDFKELFLAIPSHVGTKKWLKCWQAVAQTLGYWHASDSEGAVAKSVGRLKELTFEGFNTRAADIVNFDQRLFENTLCFHELGFTKAHVSTATGLSALALKEGVTIENAYRLVKDEIFKAVRKFTAMWVKCLDSEKQIPSGKTVHCIIFEVLKMAFDESEVERVQHNRALYDAESTEKQAKHQSNYIIIQEYKDVSSRKVSFLPREFLVFLFLGIPAGEKCHSSFKLGVNDNPDGSSKHSSNVNRGSKDNQSRRGSQETLHAIRSGDVIKDREDRNLDLEADALDIEEERIDMEKRNNLVQQQTATVTSLTELAKLLGPENPLIQESAK